MAGESSAGANEVEPVIGEAEKVNQYDWRKRGKK